MTDSILVIDDDAELCAEMEELLADAGYAVRTARDGAAGLAALEEGGCDLVILDWRMPGLSGADILKRMQEDNRRAAVLVVTGKPFTERALAVEGLLPAVSAVLAKPFDAGGLLEKVRACLSARRSPSGQPGG